MLCRLPYAWAALVPLALFAACERAPVAPSEVEPAVFAAAAAEPLVVSGMEVASGQVYRAVSGGMKVGAALYIDRPYTVAAPLPSELAGLTYIQTANDNKYASADSKGFLSFDVNRDVFAYVGHDVRFATPDWLKSDYIDTGLKLISDEGRIGKQEFRLYKKAFGKGRVKLGSNVGSEARTDGSMYTVILQPRGGAGGGETVPPRGDGDWNRVLSNVTIEGDVVVPDGESWLIGPNVQVRGNVRTHNGRIAMRPGSTLKFLGAQPGRYVGGGMHYDARFARDIGLWIGAGHGARGVLDIQCTPKASWNRTGVDPTWSASDEYWIAPSAAGDITPRRWSPGQAIPRRPIPSELHSRLSWLPASWRQQGIPTEVANVTRDCVIEGPGHIHIHSSVPQRIEYVQLRNLGVRIPGKQDSGRYALHLHMMGEGSRGTVVRGVASIGSGDRAFVPHSSHGVTMVDNVAVNSTSSAFWWDLGDPTNDLLVDRFAAIGVRTTAPVQSGFRRVGGIVLANGTNMTIRNSVAVGVNEHTVPGFDWPDGTDTRKPFSWTFEDNLSHNNRSNGLRFWPATKDGAVHEIRRYVSYNDGMDGRRLDLGASIMNAAYDPNNVRVIDALSLGSNVTQWAGARSGPRPVQAWNNLTVYNPGGIGAHFKESRARGEFTEWEKCHFVAATKVLVRITAPNNPGQPHNVRFRDCGLRPEDIVFHEPIPSALTGSRYEIWENGRHRWTVSVSPNRRKVVTTH